MTRVVTSYGSRAEIHVTYLNGREVFLASVGTCDKAIHLRNYTRFNKFLGGGCVTGILKLGPLYIRSFQTSEAISAC